MNLAPAAVFAQNAVSDLLARDARADVAAATSAPAAGGTATSELGAEGEDDGFADILSALNPLQYLPIIGTIYRAITGDQPAPGWRLGGSAITGFLMGGPIGLVTSLIGVGLEELCHSVTSAASGVDTPDAATPDAMMRGTALAAYERTGMLFQPAAGAGG